MAGIYTKTGDKGQTDLIGGVRVKKSDKRLECYGTIDEANSMLGLARAQTRDPFVADAIFRIQDRLFTVAAELASGVDGIIKDVITKKDVEYLEGVVDRCYETVGKFTGFVVPGMNTVSATLHVARTIVRRAERGMVALAEEANLSADLMKYVNRLSDAAYALARLEETNERELLKEQVRKIIGDNMAIKCFDLATMQKMAARAREKGAEMGVPIVFAAVNECGMLCLLERMEESLPVSISVAQQKAYTSWALKMPTHELMEVSKPGGDLFTIDNADPGKLILVGGGFNVVADGKTIGGVGVSGGSVAEDKEIALYAMNID